VPDHLDDADGRREPHVDLHQPEDAASRRHHAIVAGQRHHAAAGDSVAVEGVDFGLGVADLAPDDAREIGVEAPHLGRRPSHQRRQIDARTEDRLVGGGHHERANARIVLRFVHQRVGLADEGVIDGVVALGVDEENADVALAFQLHGALRSIDRRQPPDIAAPSAAQVSIGVISGSPFFIAR
jgi:hypothetical protein